MNFKQNSLFKRNTELEEEQEDDAGRCACRMGESLFRQNHCFREAGRLPCQKKEKCAVDFCRHDQHRLCPASVPPEIWKEKSH